jgi:hypothetical protein
VIAGYSFDPATDAVGRDEVFELLPTGAPDPAFNAGKPATVSTGHGDFAEAVATDTAGDIFLTGSTDHHTGGTAIDYAELSVFKITPTGALDTSWANGGVFISDPGENSFREGLGIVVQPDGRIDVGATTEVDFADTFMVLQLLPDGALDPTFNPAGPTPGENVFINDILAGIATTPSGQVVVTGGGEGGYTIDVARLAGPGKLDTRSELAVGGTPDGTAQLLGSSTATGQVTTTTLASLAPFGATAVDVRTAVADVNGDGTPDTILVTGPGTPLRVAVISGADNKTVLVQPFDPFGGDFTGGGFVAAADLDGDGRAEFVVTPDQGGGPRVSIFSLAAGGTVTTRANFLGIDDPNFRGGARAAVGDINGDGTPDLAVAAGFGGGPRVALFDGKTVFTTTPTRLVSDFFAFPGADAVNLRNGAYVALGDLNGDGLDDLIVGGSPGGAPRVLVLSGVDLSTNNVTAAQAAPISSFFVAGNSTDRGGVRVAAKNLDGDNQADLVVGSGQGSPDQVRVYLGKNITSPGEPTTFQDLTPFGPGPLADGVYVG